MRPMNKMTTALAAPYFCTRCGRELHEMTDEENSVVDYWECECGERYEITSYSESEMGEELEGEGGGSSVAAPRDPTKLVECPDSFVKAVYSVFNMCPRTLTGRSRTRQIVMAREMVSEYLYGACGLSLWSVGRVMGGRTSATVFNLLRRFQEDVRYSNEFQRELHAVLQKSGCVLSTDKHIVRRER